MLDTIKMITRASNAFNWEQAFFNTTLKEKVDSFSKTILKIMNYFMCDDLPFLNNKIRTLIQEKNTASEPTCSI